MDKMNQTVLYLTIIQLLICVVHGACANCPCSGPNWVALENEKCIKLIQISSTRDQAEKLCSDERLPTESFVPTLISIKSAAEQNYLTKYVVLTSAGVENNFWIGAKWSENRNQFVWHDGSFLDFTNWAEGRTANDIGKYCVHMQPYFDSNQLNFNGKWKDVQCETENYVVCEKPQAWSFSEMQQAVLDIQKDLSDFRKDSQCIIGDLQNQLKDMQNNPVPIGFIYVQLSDQPQPSNLWPQTQWENVSSNYAGLFFRVAGGGSAAFGTTQNENSPRIIEMENLVSGGSHSITISANNDWSLPLWTGGDTYCITGTPTCYWSTRFKASSGEVRPRNQAVQIWKRIK